jgi:hypothetical protein
MSEMKATESYSYNVLCDVCGFKMKASKLLKRWDGKMVCKDDWEPRHSLDFYTTPNDTHALPYIRTDDNNLPDVGPAINSATHTTIPTPTSGL